MPYFMNTSPPFPKVAVVFATMNRSSVALQCINSLAAQTIAPYKVYVADNDSTDGTPDQLEALANLPFPLVVHRMPENLGNAGGVQAVMDRAFDEGADAVWILDDDSWPRAEALAAMIEDGIDPNVVRHALQIDPQNGRFTWPLQILSAQQQWHLIWSENELPEGKRIRSRISWTGALIPRNVREHVGPVNGALFIRGEDEEYPWRMEKAGFTQEAVRRAILDHPGPKNMIHRHFLGKSFFFERGLADWKLYYKVRNMVWLKRLQSGNIKAVYMAIVYALFTCRYDGCHRMPILRKAIMDGWQAKLGKLC